ncbi:hypothetical protein DPEC_G00237590 [Dallia pectoralis]|uniref:Uncharacterized protein n=1 Tax=Dallia pectoralis TaxID=75939 RepID=A0ACC2FYG8_DALPE|nr:hypothetical protein DPEC_G00237590 [Dallia pectoralis]
MIVVLERAGMFTCLFQQRPRTGLKKQRLPVLHVSEDEEDMERLLRPPWPGLDIRRQWPAHTDSTCLRYHTTEDAIVEEACLAPWNMRRTDSAQRAQWPNERNCK